MAMNMLMKRTILGSLALLVAPITSTFGFDEGWRRADCRGGEIRWKPGESKVDYLRKDMGEISVYGGRQKVTAIISCPSDGVVTSFSPSGVIYYSPNCHNLGGGGQTKRVYSGNQSIKTWHHHTHEGKPGILTEFSGGGRYFSPDCQNVGGGGNTVRLN